MKTADGISKSITVGQVVGSLVGFVLLYGLLGAIDIYLLMKFARKGPDSDLSSLIPITKRKV
jgi:cytochrome d ubiquinol oxidase subunit I